MKTITPKHLIDVFPKFSTGIRIDFEEKLKHWQKKIASGKTPNIEEFPSCSRQALTPLVNEAVNLDTENLRPENNHRIIVSNFSKICKFIRHM